MSSPQPPDTPPVPVAGATLKKVGGYMLATAFGCLLAGRVIVRVAFPDMVGQGLTPEVLLILIPIWSVGVIGAVLWVIGYIRGKRA